jgi:hypothetical protein
MLESATKEVKTKETEPLTMYSEFYENGKRSIEKTCGVKIIPDIGCKATGFHRILKLSKPTNLRGIKYPDSFKYYKAISPDEYDTVQKIYKERLPSSGDGVSEFWAPLFFPKSQNASTPLQLYTLQRLELQSIHEHQFGGTTHDVGISFTPNDCVKTGQWPEAFLPEVDWFDDRLKEIKIEDILTLFPKAEQDVLALCFGRAVVGRTNHIPTGRNKPIRHAFRTMPIMFGAEPGQGKSTLANYLIQAVKGVGYRVANFNSLDSRFNLGSVVASHIAYKDDLTSKALEKSMAADNTKSIITNAQIRVEDKGVNAVELWAHCFLFSNVNRF